MKNLDLESKIYLCKYHDVDTGLGTTMHLSANEVEELIQKYKREGIYNFYRNLSESEYEKVIQDYKKSMKNNKNAKSQNQLLDLNDLLFKELNTLMNDKLSDADLDREIKISKQVVSISQTVINNANLLLQAKKHFDSTQQQNSEISPLLSLDK